MTHASDLFMGATVTALLSVGCQKKNEVPEHMQGSYRLTQLLGFDNEITVTAKRISVTECKVNCGDDFIRLDVVDCQFGSARCTFESKQCTGTLDKVRGDKELVIHARPVDDTHDVATCNNITGTMKNEP